MQDCIFCKIIRGEIPAQKVYEDEQVLAFNDIQPVAPVHILIIPKKHIVNLVDLAEEDKQLMGHIHMVASRLAKEKGIEQSGFRIISNHNKDSGQVVFHLHFHLVGGRPMGHFAPEFKG